MKRGRPRTEPLPVAEVRRRIDAMVGEGSWADLAARIGLNYDGLRQVYAGTQRRGEAALSRWERVISADEAGATP